MKYDKDCNAQAVLESLGKEEEEEELQKQRDAALFESASAQFIQIELLKQNLNQLEQQNTQLEQSYTESQKAVKRNKRISYASIAIAILSLISTILIAILK